MFLGKLGEGLYDTLGLFQNLARIPSSDSDDVGTWAGHRLITVGDYMEECPAGMLTKAEEDEMEAWLDKEERSSYYDFVAENYHKNKNPEKHITAPDDKILIMRNLSKQVYVREQDFLRYQQDKGVKADHIKGFDGLILINTAWSADDSCCIAYPGFDIIPGPWAGDRFDIAVLESFDSESWQDVTVQEAEKMVKIMKAESRRL